MSAIVLLGRGQPFYRELVPALAERGFQVIETPGLDVSEIDRWPPSVELAIVVGPGSGEAALPWVARLQERQPPPVVVYLSEDPLSDALAHRLTDELAVAYLLSSPVAAATLLDIVDALGDGQSSFQANESWGAELADLRNEYGRNLLHKLDALEQALTDYLEHPADPQRFEAARSLAHRLRGTAGSFGFSEISADAALIEDTLHRMSLPDASAWNQGCERLRSTLLRLRASTSTAFPQDAS